MPGKKWREEPDNRAEFTVRDVIAAYDLAAHRLAPEYERLTFEQVHNPFGENSYNNENSQVGSIACPHHLRVFGVNSEPVAPSR